MEVLICMYNRENIDPRLLGLHVHLGSVRMLKIHHHYQRVHMFILPKERALVVKLPNLPKDVKVNKFDSTSGKVHYLTLLSFYSEILDT